MPISIFLVAPSIITDNAFTHLVLDLRRKIAGSPALKPSPRRWPRNLGRVSGETPSHSKLSDAGQATESMSCCRQRRKCHETTVVLVFGTVHRKRQSSQNRSAPSLCDWYLCQIRIAGLKCDLSGMSQGGIGHSHSVHSRFAPPLLPLTLAVRDFRPRRRTILSRNGLLSGVFRPWRYNPVHPRIGDQLPHMFVGVNNNSQIHAIHRGVPVHDPDLAL
jgi:hypothetical protein